LLKSTAEDFTYKLRKTVQSVGSTSPDLRGDERDDQLDHDWHELHGFAETDSPPDDPCGRDIRGLLRGLATGVAPPA